MSTNPESDSPRRQPGRPRAISDDAIYMAGLQVLALHGSDGLTLGRVAEILGVTAAAVRQRFGSKRGLLVEMSRRRVEQTERRFAEARATHSSPLAALNAAFVWEMDQISEPKQIANAFSAYTDNIDDPEMRAEFATELATMERHIGEILEEAVAAGEMPGPVTPQLVSSVLAVVEGTLLIWAIAPRGEIKDRVFEAVAVVLERGRT
jgi:AcrR family transcriptional regulator